MRVIYEVKFKIRYTIAIRRNKVAILIVASLFIILLFLLLGGNWFKFMFMPFNKTLDECKIAPNLLNILSEFTKHLFIFSASHN